MLASGAYSPRTNPTQTSSFENMGEAPGTVQCGFSSKTPSMARTGLIPDAPSTGHLLAMWFLQEALAHVPDVANGNAEPNHLAVGHSSRLALKALARVEEGGPAPPQTLPAFDLLDQAVSSVPQQARQEALPGGREALCQ